MDKSLINNIKNTIPDGSEILTIKDYYTRPAILFVNLDKKEVLVVAYKNKKDIFISILAKNGDKFEVVSSIKANALGIKDLMAIPTEDKARNDLVIGWNMKNQSKLSIYSYSNGKIKSILNEDVYYNKLESGDMKGKNGYDGLYELALWRDDGYGDYNINIYRLKNKKLIIAKDVYKSYFKDIVLYYLDEIHEKGVTDIRLFKLARAEYLSGSPKEALNTLNSILNLEKYNINEEEIKKLKEELIKNI